MADTLITARKGSAFCGNCGHHQSFKHGHKDFCKKCGCLLSGLIAYPNKEMVRTIAFDKKIKRVQL